MKKRLIIGMSGASGAIYAIRMLEVLQEVDDVRTHLVISDAAQRTIGLETDYSVDQVVGLADRAYDNTDIGASIASGSYETIGMIVAPCSIKTLSGIANSFNVNLLIRAADVVLKEKRKLALMVRETPLHKGHLRLMLQAAEMDAWIVPAIPGFYTLPRTIDDIINQSVGRVLDLFDIKVSGLFERWSGDDDTPTDEPCRHALYAEQFQQLHVQ